MNLFLSLILLFLISNGYSQIQHRKVAMISIDNTNLTNHWISFKKNFLRSYKTNTEEIKRQNIFKENLKKINLHNEKYNNGSSTYAQGITQFSDMTGDEFMKFVNSGLRKESFNFLKNETHFKSSRATIPASIDWRYLGYNIPIKSQGGCGSCWAFSAVSAIEGQYFKKYGKLESFSEQNLVDCSAPPDIDPYYGCAGGWVDIAYEGIIRKGGIELDSTYPYTATNGTCKFNPANAIAKVTDYVVVTYGDENVLTEAIATVGPITAYVYVSLNFQNYRFGIFTDNNCDGTTNHAVTLVGYNTLSDQNYYILRNSWSENWGDNGYMYIAKNMNMCKIASFTTYPIVEKITSKTTTKKITTNTQSSIMFSYGTSANDLELPKLLDSYYGPVNANKGIPFFNKIYSSFYINSNGFITFLNGINDWIPYTFPTSVPIIAPFWSDINSFINGQTYFRESSSLSDINKAKNDISKIDSSFNPTKVFVFTWDQVAAYEGNSSITNTFQLVIATDGICSFMITNFQKMQWPNSGQIVSSLFGYNAGDGKTHYTHPDSYKTSITNVLFNSNVNIPGKWIFKLAYNSLSGVIDKVLTSSGNYYNSLIELPNSNIAAGNANDIQIWNVTSGQLVRTLKGHTGWVNNLAVLPNNLLASCSDDKTIRLWNTGTGSIMGKFTEVEQIISICTIKDGNLTYSTGYTYFYVRIMNINTGTIVKTLLPGSIAYSLILLNDGLLAMSSLSAVKIFNTTSGLLVRTLKPLLSEIYCLTLLPDGSLAVGGFDDKSFKNIKIVNPNNGSIIRNLTETKSKMKYAIAVLQNDVLASSNYETLDLTINLWNYKTGQLIKNINATSGYFVNSLIGLKDGRLVSTANFGNINIWK